MFLSGLSGKGRILFVGKVAVGEVDEHWHLVIAGDKEGAGPRLCEWTAWEGKQVASWDSHCLVELPVHCLVEAGEV